MSWVLSHGNPWMEGDQHESIMRFPRGWPPSHRQVGLPVIFGMTSPGGLPFYLVLQCPMRSRYTFDRTEKAHCACAIHAPSIPHIPHTSHIVTPPWHISSHRRASASHRMGPCCRLLYGVNWSFCLVMAWHGIFRVSVSVCCSAACRGWMKPSSTK